jgi:hypothetical protein
MPNYTRGDQACTIEEGTGVKGGREGGRKRNNMPFDCSGTRLKDKHGVLLTDQLVMASLITTNIKTTQIRRAVALQSQPAALNPYYLASYNR